VGNCNVSLFIIYFMMGDVIVILRRITPSQNTFITYAKTIENNIHDEIGV